MSQGANGAAKPSSVEEIRQRLVVLAREIDRLDAKLIGQFFHFEASFRSFPVAPAQSPDPVAVSTRQHIVGWFVQALRPFASTTHLLHQSQIDVRADRATAETHVTAHHVSRPDDRGRGYDTVIGARWIDQFVRVEDQWLILSRIVDFDWRYDLPVEHLRIRSHRDEPDPLSFLPGRH